jgi:hypothetical protein
MPRRRSTTTVVCMDGRFLMALVAASLACGCGTQGSSSAGGRPATTQAAVPRHIGNDATAACLRAAGATVSVGKGAGDDGAPWHEEGQIQAHLGGVEIFMDTLSDERGARYQLAAMAGLAGGGPKVDGHPIELTMGRVRNVAILFSSPPPTGTRRAVEGCLGERMRFDPMPL